MFTIGVDIGGTNTDAVLLDEQRNIVAKVKRPTTTAIDEGFYNAISALPKRPIRAVFVGTTHATNALLQRKDLYRVGLIRIAGNSPFLPPCFGWPEDLRDTLLVDSITINGGCECDGREITPFSLEEAKQAIALLISKGAESIAVVGVFSPLYPDQEKRLKSLTTLPISLSHQIGGVGILERENSTLLNAALRKPLEKGFQRLQEVLTSIDIHAPLYLTQNNGTILALDKALEYPILTISAGPTNSFIGASRLANLDDTIVVDIGGTSTDVGIVSKGYPRRSLNRSNIGGIPLNFPMPDVLSIALGGGSYVTLNPPQIGPESCGKEILQKALCFGGSHLTLTDLAIAQDPSLIPGTLPVDCPQSLSLLQLAATKIQHLIEKMAGDKSHLPVLIVGGGAPIFKTFFGPPLEDASVANAYGAALAEIAATVDTIVSLTDRDTQLEKIIQQSITQAISQGADPKTTRLVDLQIIPYHYIPGNITRVIATASGLQTVENPNLLHYS